MSTFFNKNYLIFHYVFVLTITHFLTSTIKNNLLCCVNNTQSIYFVLIILLIIPITIYIGVLVKINKKAVNALLILIEIFLFFCFFTKNLLLFYISFEALLIPMYLLIGIEGQGFRKKKASILLIIYTLLGSFFMLFSIIYISIISNTLNYNALNLTKFSFFQQKVICFCFLIAFFVKIPCFPFHLWLPEAHVEASTVGSIILASLILKLPAYGLIIFVLNWFPYACVLYETTIEVIACVSIIYSSLASFRQLDLKKIIAYTSISHMNLAVLGIFTENTSGIFGAIYLMIGHAVISSALFFCIGVLYARFHTKNIYYFGGITQIMPLTCVFFFIFSLSNLSFPGTSNFIGEIIILSNLFNTNVCVLIISCSSVIFSAIYSIWLFNRVCFGTIKTKYIVLYKDINVYETSVLLLFVFLNIIFGITSSFLFKKVCFF